MTKFEYAMAKSDSMTRLAHPSGRGGTDTRAFYAKAAEGFRQKALGMTVEEAEDDNGTDKQ